MNTLTSRGRIPTHLDGVQLFLRVYRMEQHPIAVDSGGSSFDAFAFQTIVGLGRHILYEGVSK